MDLDLIQVLDGVVDKLFGFFGSGDDGRRGRPLVYPAASMIGCFLVMFLKGLDSERDLAAFLRNHPELWLPLRLSSAPVATTLGRFRRRFGSQKLTECVDWFAGDTESGEVVVDAALMEKNDGDTEWGFSDSSGWVLGYKTHVSCDARSGLPLRIRLTTANRHESPLLPELVGGLNPSAVIANSGYDSEDNVNHVMELDAVPAIAYNKRGDKNKGYANKKSKRNKARKNKKRKKLLRKRYIVEQLNNLIHEVLQLKNRFINGLEACSFYTQLTALRLLAQAEWATKKGLHHLKRQIKHFKRR